MYDLPDRTLGDMIMHDFLGRQGIYTGTGANIIVMENRRCAQERERTMRQSAPPTPPALVPPSPVSFVPPPMPPVIRGTGMTSVIQRKAPRIPLWKLLMIAYGLGLLTPFLLF